MPKLPIQQAKENLLKILRDTSPDVEEIIYPCLPQDLADYRSALELVEVQQEFNRRGVRATIELYTDAQKHMPQILIATIENATNGTLDEYLKRHGMR